MSIGEKLDRANGGARGFDVIRLFLTILIIAYHSRWIVSREVGVNLARESWFQAASVVPVFFALSGFLVAGSAQRLPLRHFLINRALRIGPALAVEVVGSAFILGAIFTTLPLASYFAQPHLWRYLLNIVGFISFSLPGVFEDLPMSGMVNISLWTIPWELVCYGLICLFILSGLARRPGPVALGFVAYGLAGLAVEVLQLAVGQDALSGVLQHVFFGAGPKFILFFGAGFCAYQVRYKIPYRLEIFAAAAVVCILVATFAPTRWGFSPIVSLLTVLPLSYMVLFGGVSDLPSLPILHRGDYSYGMFLYAFPIQQAVMAAVPGLDAPVLTLIALPLVAAFAALSWHFVEKPILKMRRRFSFVARTRLSPVEQGAEPAAQRPSPGPALAGE
ncbi:MAG: acyltransferase [Phenylobacterium sp.]|nr:acyltransferase [Phenylobacterium sp.]